MHCYYAARDSEGGNLNNEPISAAVIGRPNDIEDQKSPRFPPNQRILITSSEERGGGGGSGPFLIFFLLPFIQKLMLTLLYLLVRLRLLIVQSTRNFEESKIDPLKDSYF